MIGIGAGSSKQAVMHFHQESADGQANDDIAAELVLSKRTVETHITRIRAKLDFSERAQIVRWAIAAGLVPINDQIHL